MKIDKLNVALWIALILLGVLLVCAAGCHRLPNFGEKMTGEALGRADARQLYIIDEAKVVQPKDAGKRITLYATDTRKDLEEAAKGSEMQAEAYAKRDAEYTSLSRKWYVWVGRKIELIALVAAISWAVLGTFGAFFVGAGGPLGFMARHVLNFLPLANPFTALARQRQAVVRG